MNYEFLVLNQRKKYDSKLPKVEFFSSCPALAKVVIYTMPIDIVQLGKTTNYLAQIYTARFSLRSVRTL